MNPKSIFRTASLFADIIQWKIAQRLYRTQGRMPVTETEVGAAGEKG